MTEREGVKEIKKRLGERIKAKLSEWEGRGVKAHERVGEKAKFEKK